MRIAPNGIKISMLIDPNEMVPYIVERQSNLPVTGKFLVNEISFLPIAPFQFTYEGYLVGEEEFAERLKEEYRNWLILELSGIKEQ